MDVSHVKGGVEFVGQLGDFNLEALLDFEQDLFVSLLLALVSFFGGVLVGFHEVDSKALCAEPAGSTDSVQISVSVLGEVFIYKCNPYHS